MRKAKQLQVLGCAAAAVFGMSSAASAALLIYEPFDYTSGQAITGQMNTVSAQPETWLQAGTVATSGNVHIVDSPGLTAPSGLPAAIGNMAHLKQSDVGELERLNIPNAFNTDNSVKYGANSTLYYSLLLNIPSTTGAGTAANHTNPNENNDIIAGFNNSQGSQASRPNSWNGELVFRQGVDASHFDLGIRASTTTASTTFFSQGLNVGQTYFIVVEAQEGPTLGTAANGTNSIWVNPSSATFGADEMSRPNADGFSNGEASNTAGNDSAQSLLIGSGIATGAAPSDMFVDELRVGDTWADVTGATAVVQSPEPSGLALIGAGLMALASKRRRRRAT